MRTARGTIGSRASHHETLFLKNNHFLKKIFCRSLFLEHQGTVSLKLDGSSRRARQPKEFDHAGSRRVPQPDV